LSSASITTTPTPLIAQSIHPSFLPSHECSLTIIAHLFLTHRVPHHSLTYSPPNAV
jgi:hypothetical protein